MPNPRVRLYGEQFRHRNRSRPAHPRQVVAHQIDDHDVLGGVLGRGLQTSRGRSVRSARGGALDRRRDHLTAPHPQEQLGAEAGDHPGTGVGLRPGGQGPVRRFQLRRRLREDHRGRPAGPGVQPDAEVQLIEVAPVDPADHLLDRGQVAVPGQPGGLPGDERAHHQRVGSVRLGREWGLQPGGPVRQRRGVRRIAAGQAERLERPAFGRPPAQQGVVERQAGRPGGVAEAGQPTATDQVRRRRVAGRRSSAARPARRIPSSAEPGVCMTSGRTMINTPPPNQSPHSTPGWSALGQSGDDRLRASVRGQRHPVRTGLPLMQWRRGGGRFSHLRPAPPGSGPRWSPGRAARSGRRTARAWPGYAAASAHPS